MTEQKPEIDIPIQHKPEFDGGTFTIDFLSASANGFEVKTSKTERRRPREESDPRFSKKNLPLDSDQKITLKNAMVGQMKFAHGDVAKQALDKLREAKEKDENPEVVRQLGEDYENKRKNYHHRAFPRVSLKNVEQEGNTLTVDLKPADFPSYAEFGKPESTSELIDFSNIASTSVVLVTKDKRLIIQHRSTKNKLFADVPGTSAAGFFDAKPPTDPKAEDGIINPIDTNCVKDNAIKEAHEELGISKEDIADIRITALSQDKVQIHDEFALFGKLNLNTSELKKKTQNAQRNIKLSDEEFYEKFVDVPATPEAISILLTEVKCPIPPTLAGSFVASAYSMMLEEKGLEEANRWKNEMEFKIRKNYQEINQMIENYYHSHPEELSKATKGRSPKNPKGYDPAYLPSEQGLPDLISELKRVKLIPDKENETMKSVDHMIILDVDGVITDPKEKIITEPEILDQIVSRLEKGEPVALNTGRSIEWVIDRVLNPLTEKIKDKKILQNLLAVGEKGGTWAEFDDQGNLTQHKDENISVPDSLKDKIRDLINKKYSDSMFFDESKLTMISTEMKDGLSLEDYRKKQEAISSELQALLDDNSLNNRFKIDPTTIAVDVENKFVGKHFAVRRILEWVRGKGFNPKQYIALGDSFKSDISMAEEINSQKLPVEFVYVGEDDIDTSRYPFTIRRTEVKFGKGALEFLKTTASS
ncbi:MAG: hypothetical protein Q8P26_01970 [Candidatus Levybacteria bacterium]|nr:hypothetical protein [Candidatus Levybacteria bacterium]